MMGRLSEILPEPISPESEAIILGNFERKLMGTARLTVSLLRAMEKRFGPEVRQVLKDMVEGRDADPRPTGTGDPRDDLHAFCDGLEQGCAGSHE